MTPSVINVGGGYDVSDSPHIAALNRGLAVRVGDYLLTVTHHYRIVEDTGVSGPWRVRTAAYAYAIDEEASGQELLAFHWHPSGRSVTWPHIHLGHALTGGDRKRLPSGRIALEQVLRMLIDEFGVQPRRDDWRDVLTETQEAFETYRTWG